MNVLFLSLLYPRTQKEEISHLSRDGMQNQIDNYQWAFVDGLRNQMQPDEHLDILNCLPVGTYPKSYRRFLLHDEITEEGIQQIGCINLPYLKQKHRARKAEQAIEAWIAKDADNRTLLIYTLYLPYMQAIQRIKRRHPDVKAHMIVTDLPNEYGISSGRHGLLKRAEYAMGDQRIALCAELDGFVLLTRYMTERLPIEDHPQIVIEGLILPAEPLPASKVENAVLYAGTLNRELGLEPMLHAFAAMPDIQLWICGKGDMQQQVSDAAKRYPNIHYFGYVSQQRSLQLQSEATALINPRTSEGAFTRYSFPSKTLEYMRSGKPVLCNKLQGIPDEYHPYLLYFPTEDAAGIQQAIRTLFAWPEEKRECIGKEARRFALQEKSADHQCAKLLQWMRSIYSTTR